MKINRALVFLIFFQFAVYSQSDSSALDTTTVHVSTDSLVSARNAIAIDFKTEKSPIERAKKKYNHREQVLFACGMMAFLAIVLSTAQMWNPD
jgi:hypothetical protein